MYGGKNTGDSKNPVFLPETNGFLNNTINPEVLLGWPVGEALTAHNAWMNPFGTSYGGAAGEYQRIDNRLYEKIDDNDYRKDVFLKTDFESFPLLRLSDCFGQQPDKMPQRLSEKFRVPSFYGGDIILSIRSRGYRKSI